MNLEKSDCGNIDFDSWINNNNNNNNNKIWEIELIIMIIIIIIIIVIIIIMIIIIIIRFWKFRLDKYEILILFNENEI